MARKKTPTRRTSRSRPGPPDPIEQLLAAGDRTTAYAVNVLAGRYVAGPHVRNACRRHLQDLAEGQARGLRYDLAAAQHVWGFFEGVLKLSEGQFEGIPFKLHPSQAFKLGSIFGWKRADGTRRFRRAYIEEGKGNGKSPFAGGVGLYMMTADGEAGAEIYAAGARKEQAAILFRDAVKMCRKSPALYPRRVRFSGGVGREYNIAQLATGSFFRPISKEAGRTGSGPRPACALCDEVHEHPNRDVMEMLERGFKFRRQPLLLMITNSGSDRNSVCWEEHQHAVRVAAGTMTPDEGTFAYVGEPIDDATFSFVCSLDAGDDPLTDPSCWPKANPLLGVLLTEDYIAGVVAQARQIPGKLNGILRLHFCVWTDADQAWISREALEAVLADFDPYEEHKGKQVSAGLDLSGSRDLTAAGFVVETHQVERVREDGSTVELPFYDLWVEAWTPAETLAARALADQAPYDVWVREGWLRTTPGQQVRFDVPAAFLGAISTVFLILWLAFDRYAFARFQDALDELGLTIDCVEHPQGGKRRASPPPELVDQAKRSGREPPLGLWMPGSLNTFEELVLDRRCRIRRSPVFVSAAMSAAIEEDAFGNRWFSKRKATQRIDPLVAAAMAIGAATMASPGPLITGADAVMVI